VGAAEAATAGGSGTRCGRGLGRGGAGGGAACGGRWPWRGVEPQGTDESESRRCAQPRLSVNLCITNQRPVVTKVGVIPLAVTRQSGQPFHPR
jgi:hypothetical protein